MWLRIDFAEIFLNMAAMEQMGLFGYKRSAFSCPALPYWGSNAHVRQGHLDQDMLFFSGGLRRFNSVFHCVAMSYDSGFVQGQSNPLSGGGILEDQAEIFGLHCVDRSHQSSSFLGYIAILF